MKKVLFLPVLIVIMATFISSCEKVMPETYVTECKIDKMWVRAETGDPDIFFHYGDDGFLKRIDLSDSTYYEFQYDPESYNRLTTITHYNKDYLMYPYMEMITLHYERYDNNENVFQYVYKMDYLIEGSIKKTINFTRRNDKTITSIKSVYDSTFYNHLPWIFDKSTLYKMFMGDDDVVLEHLMKKNKSEQLTLETFSFPIYDAKGENIVQIYKKVPDLNLIVTTNISYSYDTYNPFYGLPFAYVNLWAYSKHARVLESSVLEYSDGEATTISQKTFYYPSNNDKSFPERIIIHDTDYNNMPWNLYILYK